jgi:hypothetical protein
MRKPHEYRNSEMRQEGKTIREITSAAHMSFSDISNVIGKVNRRANDTKISNKSKAPRALFLFKSGKKPIDVAIELDLSVNEVHDLQQEFWALNPAWRTWGVREADPLSSLIERLDKYFKSKTGMR